MRDRLNYEVIGSETLPTVALLHGMLSSNRQWAPNIDALSARFRLVPVELWGHGESPTPDDPDAFAIDGLIEALDEVRRETGSQTWSVIGYSYGGALALQYALRRPEHTSAVVFTNSRAAMATTTPDECEQNAAGFMKAASVRELPFHPIHAGRLPAEIRDELVDAADGTSAEAVGRLMRTSWQLSIRSRLAELTVPVTLVNGRHERAFQPDAEAIRRLAPQIDVFDVDAGHAVNMQAAEAFNEIAVRALL